MIGQNPPKNPRLYLQGRCIEVVYHRTNGQHAAQSVSHASATRYGNTMSFRLPTAAEMVSLMANLPNCFDGKSDYWTSDINPAINDYAMVVNAGDWQRHSLERCRNQALMLGVLDIDPDLGIINFEDVINPGQPVRGGK